MAGTPAGLPAGVRLSDHISLGVIARAFPPDRVRQILAETGKASERERDLPAQVMVYYAIALALYMGSRAVNGGDILERRGGVKLEHGAAGRVRRTRAYRSTAFISHAFRPQRGRKAAGRRSNFAPPQPDYPAASVREFLSAALSPGSRSSSRWCGARRSR